MGDRLWPYLMAGGGLLSYVTGATLPDRSLERDSGCLSVAAKQDWIGWGPILMHLFDLPTLGRWLVAGAVFR